MAINDNTYMKFGKYSGKRLADVPAEYLLWLQGNLGKKKKLFGFEKALWEYILDNQEVLEKELEDGKRY